MEPAILGTARLANFRLGYRPAALTALRETRVRITLEGVPIRVRRGSVTIRDVLNDEPNTCSLTIDAANPPETADRLRVTINSDTPRLLFAGALQGVNESYEGKPAQRVFPCMAQDDTPRANRRIPLGRWTNTSATTVAQWLVATFIPGFTATHVQAGLPAVTLLFDGSEAGVNGCLRQLAKLIGGYFYWEDADLHLFQEEANDAPDPLDMTPGRFLDNPPITAETNDNQVRTRVYGKGHAEQTLEAVDAGATTIPLGDVSFFEPSGGQAISEEQILGYTGTVVGGAGARIGTTITPTNGPTVTPRATTGMTAGARSWATTFTTAAGETLPSPLVAVTLGGTVPAPSPAPTAGSPTGGGGVTSGAHAYKVSWVTGIGETLAGPASNSVTTGGASAVPISPPGAPTVAQNGTGSPGYQFGFTYNFWVTFVTSLGETTVGTMASITITNPAPASLDFTNIPIGPSGTTARKLYGSFGLIKTIADNSTTTTTDSSNPSGASPPSSNTAYVPVNTVPLTAIPIGPTGTTSRKVYRTAAGGSTYKLLTTIADNTTTTYTDTTADGSLGADELATGTALYLAADLSGISVGPSGTTGRKVYRTAAAGSQLKLLTTIANNTTTTFTDTTADGSLGANAPTSDTSGLVGQTGDVPAGSTTLLLTSTGFALAAGGWAFIGAMPIHYTGISGATITGIPATGPGSLTTTVNYGVEIVAASMLTGVTGLTLALVKGAPVHVWVQRDDLGAQAELAARDGTDGIIEHRIVDERRNAASLIALCDADLAQFSRPLITVCYASRDVQTKSGKPIVIDITSPDIQQTLTIQDVTITEIDIAPRLAPRFTVTASTIRFSVEDILRRMASTSLGGQ